MASHPSPSPSGAILEIAFDYVDPGSYMVQRLLSRWSDGRAGKVEEGGAPPFEVVWSPLELRLPGDPLLDAEDAGWDALTRAVGEEAQGLGWPFRRPRAVPRTRKAHELALHARGKGVFEAVHDALFRAHFEESRDLGRVDVLVALASEAGLDPAESRTVLGVDRFLQGVREERARLLADGVRGVPTVRLLPAGHAGTGGMILLEGYGGADAFLDAMNAGAEARAAWTQSDNRGR